jgi:hypothetical protein
VTGSIGEREREGEEEEAYPIAGAPGKGVRRAGVLLAACLFLSASVSSTRIGRPMTIVPLNAMAFSTSSIEASSTYPILKTGPNRKSQNQHCPPLPVARVRSEASVPLGPP